MDTRDECIRNRLFALPGDKLSLMKDCIVVGKTPLFLFDFSDKCIHGVFVAESEPGRAFH